MIAGLMKMSAVAETSFVEKTRKPASAAARPAAPRKRAPAKPRSPRNPSPRWKCRHGRASLAGRRRLAVAGLVVLVAAAAGAAFAPARGRLDRGRSSGRRLRRRR